MQTFDLGDRAAREEALDRLEELVVKPRGGSGGVGVVIGPHASVEELAATRAAIGERPENFIAQETVMLSTHPTVVGGSLRPRHIDLRPFVFMTGQATAKVLPGGLTRVALRGGLADRQLVPERRREGHMGTELMATLPLIGVTTSEVRMPPQSQPIAEGDPPQREMVLGMPYMKAVERAGGIPVVLPPLPLEFVPSLLDHLDGVCLSGGPDIDPAGYGDRPHPQLGDTEPGLDAFELAIARAADESGLPLLGVCRGSQAMNVARGGTLFQHIPDVTDGSVIHREGPGKKARHQVDVAEESRLAAILRTKMTIVNSFHHQAIDRLGSGLHAVAWSPDGMIEAIEGEGERLFLGVQWHAESLIDDDAQLALFETLVAEATCGHMARHMEPAQ